MNLIDAITGVEQAQTAYNGAVAQTNNDLGAADALRAKLDAANATVAADKTAQGTAASAFNAALDSLIAAANAAKIGASA